MNNQIHELANQLSGNLQIFPLQAEDHMNGCFVYKQLVQPSRDDLWPHTEALINDKKFSVIELKIVSEISNPKK